MSKDARREVMPIITVDSVDEVHRFYTEQLGVPASDGRRRWTMRDRTSIGRLILVPALLTLAVTVLRLAGELTNGSPTLFSRAVGGGAAVVGIIWLVPARRGWLRLWQVLLAYGFAARIPVAIVILLGILNGWNTHYDSPPPGLPELSPFARWIAIGLIPQFTIWIAVTVILGILAGAASLALVPPSRVRAPAGS